MPRINLIPWREAERKRKRQEFGVGAIAALAAAAVITFAVNWQMQGAVDRQNKRNEYLKTQIAELDKQITEILALDQKKQQLQARIQVIEQLELSRPEVVHLFDQLARTLPDGINLSAVKQTDRLIEIRGQAQSSTRVASYMRNIDSSEWLADPTLDILETKDTSGTSDFTLKARQENPQQPASAQGSKGAAP
jgi:type IV pilus assembly protein PilN